MGCDTSKESVQPGEEEAKEDYKNGDIPKATQNNVFKEEALTPPTPSKESGEGGEAEAKEDPSDLSEQQKEAAAAITIQAVFRGYNARKTMKDSEPPGNNKMNGKTAPKQHAKSYDNITDTTTKDVEAAENLKNELENIDLTDEKLNTAAATIQGGFRRHMKRKEETGGKLEMVNNGTNK